MSPFIVCGEDRQGSDRGPARPGAARREVPARLSTRAAADPDLVDAPEPPPAERAFTSVNRRRLVRHLLALEARRLEGAAIGEPETNTTMSPDLSTHCEPAPRDRETS